MMMMMMSDPSKKRQRADNNSAANAYVAHPYGVKPRGNLLLDVLNENFICRRTVGLGVLAVIEDNNVIDILEYLQAEDLSSVALVSRAFYVFCQEEDLWKYLCLNKFQGNFRFYQTWQQTMKRNSNPKFNVQHVPIPVSGFYSDYLFHIWRCISTDMSQWDTPDNIERRSGLSLEEFTREYFIPNKPVILTDVMNDWPAMTEWTKEKMIAKYGDVEFFINSGVNMKLRDYWEYVSTVKEEMPMYLFDHDYGERCPSILDDYKVPIYFQDDLFSLMGDERPSYRWLLLGPARAGASFHKDPNHTSAWNGVITGSKKWVMYPPNVVPPGVHPSADGHTVATPVSIMEWFINFYEKKKKSKGKGGKKRGKKQFTAADFCNPGAGNDNLIDGEDYEPFECTLRAGEMIFVPSGWWHTVLNLEESLAVTQNFCNQYNVHNVMRYIRTKEKKDLEIKFTKALRTHRPDLVEQLGLDRQTKISSSSKMMDVDGESAKPLSYWQQIKAQENTEEADAFSFDFGCSDASNETINN